MRFGILFLLLVCTIALSVFQLSTDRRLAVFRAPSRTNPARPLRGPVTATSQGTGVSRQAKTDEAGTTSFHCYQRPSSPCASSFRVFRLSRARICACKWMKRAN